MNTAIDIDVRNKTAQLLQGLCEGLYEREEAIKLSLLSTVAGESIFLLGPPGVGKSLIARRLKYAFKDGTSFEYLMSKFSTPDEIFGPVSIRKLKDEDRYERLTDNYLPGANIVFLDEIWKAGPAIQNALLTILNEKVYRNGERDIPVNIRGIITASNELPPRNQSLAPIWDRFLLRLEIGNIRQFKNFLNMIVDTEDVYHDKVTDEAKVTVEELDGWSERIDAVEAPPEVLNTIQVLKVKLDEYNSRPNNTGDEIHVFDRRWKKIIRLLRTSAFLNGRSKIDLMDCFLMVHALWSKPEQKETLQEMVNEAIRRHGYTMAVNLQMIKREVADFEQDVDREIKVRYTTAEEHPMPVQEEYYELEKEEQRFEGYLLPIKQFQRLTIEEPKVTNFYDHDLNLVNRLKAQRGRAENTIELFHNSEKYTFTLRTRQIERTEVIYKKPHPIVEEHWEERFQKLNNYINRQETKIRDNAPDELNHLQENHFVEARYAEIVTANLREVAEALRNLRLRLEKVQYAYASLEG